MSKVNLRESGQGWDDFDFEESVPKAAVPCSIQMSMLGFVLDSSRSSARGILNHSQLCSQIVLGLFADFASEEFRIGVSVVSCSKFKDLMPCIVTSQGTQGEGCSAVR